MGEINDGDGRRMGVERLCNLPVGIDFCPRGDALEDFETIGIGEEAHATDTGVVDQLFALVRVGIDPLVHRVLLAFPLRTSWVASLVTVMVPATPTFIFAIDMVSMMILAVRTMKQYCMIKDDEWPMFGARLLRKSLDEMLVAALVMWQGDCRHPRMLHPIIVLPDLCARIAESRR
eukprot:scaffold205062_cov55-Attheya_sp.AAC.1